MTYAVCLHAAFVMFLSVGWDVDSAMELAEIHIRLENK